MDKQTESRSQFEVWATKSALQLDKDTDAWGREKYKYHMIQALWDGWQASRDSIEITLPELFEDDRNEVSAAIKAAGVRVTS